MSIFYRWIYRVGENAGNCRSVYSGAIKQHCITFWRPLYENGAELVATRAGYPVNPPLATGTYPAWYTAALRTSARVRRWLA